MLLSQLFVAKKSLTVILKYLNKAHKSSFAYLLHPAPPPASSISSGWLISKMETSSMQHSEGFDQKEEDQSSVPVHACHLQTPSLRLFPAFNFERIGCHVLELNLDNSNISYLPCGLHNRLPLLETLSINANDLSLLPEDIGHLNNLKELSLRDNNISILPETLCRLSKLKILDADCNKLTKLYNEIGQNLSLEMIKVNGNTLRRLPATFGLLSNLRVLEANDNQIDLLPSTINFLENLRILKLRNNRLTTIPPSFGELEKLSHIDLSDNGLRHLCETFKSTVALEYLDLDSNKLTLLPDWFKDLENIMIISMKNNNLSNGSVQDGFGFVSKKLKILDLSGNALTHLPESIGHLESLQILLLGTSCNNQRTKNYFQIGNWLESLPLSFIYLTSLTKLHIEDNQLRVLPEEFGRLNNLEELYLGSNMFAVLPGSFTQLSALKQCNLSKNRLEFLPDDFGNLEALIELCLYSNKLKELPLSMKNLKNLEILNLSENRILFVPEEIASGMIKLRTLKLSHLITSSQEDVSNDDSVLETIIKDCEEDWDIDSTVSTSDVCVQCLDKEVRITSGTISDTYVVGQFDLDGEESSNKSALLLPVQFDSFGNSNTSFHLSHLNWLPFNHHKTKIIQQLFNVEEHIPGQFDSAEEFIMRNES